MNKFYVYEWFNTETKEVFYVGKGKNGRYKNKNQRNQYFKNYYNKYKCDVRKVKIDLTEKEAFDYEIKLIKSYRDIGQCKCNISDGGEGATFEEGSWNDLFRKLQYLHDCKRAMDDMHNEEEYDVKNLKNKTLKEIEELYNKYIEYNENKKMTKEYYDDIGFKPNNITGFELDMQNQEIVMLTDLISRSVANNNKEFKDFLTWKTEMDFMCFNFDSDKFLDLIFNESDYYKELITVILNVLWFMKKMNDSSKVKVPLKIRSYRIEDKYIHIKFNTEDCKTMRRVKINLYDIVWGILMFKNEKALYDIIYQEIFFAPFL